MFNKRLIEEQKESARKLRVHAGGHANEQVLKGQQAEIIQKIADQLQQLKIPIMRRFVLLVMGHG
jgi:hypothetical protein